MSTSIDTKFPEDKPNSAMPDSANQSDTEAKAATYNAGQTSDLVLGGPEEKALIRKLDLHIIPVVMTLYLLSFLDR